MSTVKLTLENLLKIYLDSNNFLVENQIPELEVKFGTRGVKKITKIDFDNVIKQLLFKGFNFLGESKYYLRTITKDIRTEIEGLNNIRDYCKVNHLPVEIPSQGYKFLEKKVMNLEEGIKTIVNFDEFNFRVAFNLETEISSDSPQIRRLLETWHENEKFYRLINRFTMVHPDYPVLIDLSIVRETTKNNLRESNIFNQPQKYEIEVELNNTILSSSSKEETSASLEILIKKISKMVLSGLQGTNFPISNTEQIEVLNSYLQLIKGKSYEYTTNGKPIDFIGPSSYTLQLSNIVPESSSSKIPNIRKNYTVTDKADGDRKLLYVSSNGKLYLITTTLNVQFTGAETKKKEYFNSLIDGEHIIHDKNKKFINLYGAFDIYFINKEDVRRNEFVPSEDKSKINYRLPMLVEFLRNLKITLVNSKELPPIKIVSKKFCAENEKNTIFKCCYTIQKEIDQGLYEYNTDGFIFTQSNLGVGLNAPDEIPKSHKITWDHSFKWKPAEYNTVDFLITIKKLPTGIDFIGNIFQDGTNTSAIDQILQYKTIILRVGYDERKHGYINPCENIKNDQIPRFHNLEDANTYRPVQFFPSNPYDPDAGITNIVLKLDDKSKNQMLTEENEIIEDETIVEFRYDITREKGWRWIPLRIRYDKTAEYRAGHKNFGNAYHVAQSNWKSIHNPITIEMLTSGNGIPEESGDDEIYYDKPKGNSNTRPLRDFHNLYVKRKLIMGVSNPGDTLIDYAVGKGGDIPKWRSAELSFVFGIDLSKDNIENRLDGICVRYLKSKQNYRSTPDGLFIQGNSSKNIRNLSAQFTENGKTITKAIFGEGPKDEALLGKGIYKAYGIGTDGFNISSIQFGIHYMFENINILENFLINVAECTKLNGYFVGTSFDGKKIFELLKDKKQNETLVIRDDKNKEILLELTKLYDRNEIADNISCLGYGINVFQESINKTFKEYLVNYDYLQQVLEKFGFVPLSSEELKTLKSGLPSSIGNFDELFNGLKEEIQRNPKKKNEYGSALNLKLSEQKISFLNKYFIFKKVRNVNISDITINLTQQTENEVTELSNNSAELQETIKKIKPKKSVVVEKKLRNN